MAWAKGARRRLTPEERAAREQQALERAQGSTSIANEAAAIAEFVERGIPESECIPRVNILTFHAWKACGRYVRKGEHGVKLTVWVPTVEDGAEGEEPTVTGKRPVTAVVFHISQTDSKSDPGPVLPGIEL